MIDFAAWNAGYPATVTPIELAEALTERQELRLIDVREPEEARLRRIRGSELIPLGDLVAGAKLVADVAAVHSVEGSGKNSSLPFLFYCEHDGRSQYAAQFLIAQGYVVGYLVGGIADFAPTASEHIDQF